MHTLTLRQRFSLRRFHRGLGPEAGPVQLDRSRIFILPSSTGLLFAMVLLVMLLGAINYANNMGYMFTFLLGSMALVSVLHSYRNLARLQFTAARAVPVFADVDPETLLDRTINYGLFYACHFLNTGKELAKEILNENIERGAVKVGIPVKLGFHSRPSLLVAKIVQYYGGQVAAPVFAEVMEKTLRVYGVAPDDLQGQVLLSRVEAAQ